MKNIKKLITLFLTISLVCSLLCTTAMAITCDNDSSITNKSYQLQPYAISHGDFDYPNDTTVVIQNDPIRTIYYRGMYGLWGSSGIIVLRFTNVDTGYFWSWTFVVDNQSHEDKTDISIPAGTYRISVVANTVKNFSQLLVNIMG